MTPLVRSRPQRVAAAVVFVGMGAVGFAPLFGGPGYEHALASGLVVPTAAAIATALELSDGRSAAQPGQDVKEADVAPLSAVGRGVSSGLALAGVAFFTALLHALRVGMCDLAGGALGFVLTCGFGAALGGLWGASAAEIARGKKWRRTVAVFVALAAPVLGVVVSVARFYTSPMIFAFDPFVGYFSGTLYDTVIDAGTPLLTYRVGSLATLVASALVASVLARDASGRLSLVPLRADAGARARAVLGALALAVSLGITMKGAALGHWETTSTIEAELGGSRRGQRCDVVYPDSMRADETALLVKDCEEELASVEKVLGARGPERVTAFFFRDAAEKKRLMGAADTYVAKPWRHEVYLQVAPYPHPVLGHELAHVVAGTFGRGPFRVAGALAGLWPNPGLIEGVAVAASPDDDELTDREWAHAMREIGALPPIATVFSFDFLGASAAKSYTLAGAFVRWTLDRYGAPTVRAWYGGASLEALTSRSWAELDGDFRADVAKIPLQPEAEAYAKAKFERPAIFQRKCPHVVDGLRQKADRCREAHQIDRAVVAYGEALARDPHDYASRYGRGVAELRYGDAGAGRRELGELVEEDKVPRTWRDRAADALADGALLARDYEGAARAYDALAARSLDEDFGRTCEVKALAARDAQLRRDEPSRFQPSYLELGVEALLMGAPGRPADPVLAAARLGEAESRIDAVSAYLIGKNLAQRGWYAEAAEFLQRAMSSPPTPRIGREALRQRVIAACALGGRGELELLAKAVATPDGPYAKSVGRRDALERLMQRCAPR